MRALAELDGLGHHVHAADDDGRVEVDGGAEDAELLRDLEGELSVCEQVRKKSGGGRESSREREGRGDGPSRGEDDGVEAVGVSREPLEDREGEGDRLARARLGGPDAVGA